MSFLGNVVVGDVEVTQGLRLTNYIDTSDTPGPATANAVRGKSAIAAGDTYTEITNSYVTSSSQVIAQCCSQDIVWVTSCVALDGLFQVYLNDASQNNVAINWVILN